MIAQQAEKFARYSELRDGGAHKADVTREMGISQSTATLYERAYKRARGIPFGHSSVHWGDR